MIPALTIVFVLYFFLDLLSVILCVLVVELLPGQSLESVTTDSTVIADAAAETGAEFCDAQTNTSDIGSDVEVSSGK